MMKRPIAAGAIPRAMGAHTDSVETVMCTDEPDYDIPKEDRNKQRPPKQS